MTPARRVWKLLGYGTGLGLVLGCVIGGLAVIGLAGGFIALLLLRWNPRPDVFGSPHGDTEAS